MLARADAAVNAGRRPSVSHLPASSSGWGWSPRASWPGLDAWDADTLAVRAGTKVLATTTLERHRSRCSTHVVEIAHADAARGFAVLTDRIASTGHNCDGRREAPELTVVRWKRP